MTRLTDPFREIERVRQACYDAGISCDAVMALAQEGAARPEGGAWIPATEAVGDDQPRWITDGSSVGVGGQLTTGHWFVAVLFAGTNLDGKRVTHYMPIQIPTAPPMNSGPK